MSKRCIAKALSGSRCAYDALDGSNFCKMHGPDAIPVFLGRKATKKVAKKAKKKAAKKR